MRVKANLMMVCGFVGCPWSMAIDPEAGADPMAVHAAYLDHLDQHDDADCGTADPAPSFTCPQCQAVSYHPEDVRQGYCGRCHAFAGAQPTGGIYAGQLYDGDTPEQIAAEQTRIDRFMAGGEDR